MLRAAQPHEHCYFFVGRALPADCAARRSVPALHKIAPVGGQCPPYTSLHPPGVRPSRISTQYRSPLNGDQNQSRAVSARSDRKVRFAPSARGDTRRHAATRGDTRRHAATRGDTRRHAPGSDNKCPPCSEHLYCSENVLNPSPGTPGEGRARALPCIGKRPSPPPWPDENPVISA